jgi:hypothetical protein
LFELQLELEWSKNGKEWVNKQLVSIPTKVPPDGQTTKCFDATFKIIICELSVQYGEVPHLTEVEDKTTKE